MTLVISLILMILALAACYAFIKPIEQIKMESNRRKIVAMLVFFLAIIAMSTAFFSGWNILKTGKVALYENKIVIGQSAIPFTNIKNVIIETDRGTSLINPKINTRSIDILLIEEKSGAVHAISEEQYPVGEIMKKLKELTEK